MNTKEIRDIIIGAINDSKGADPIGPDRFVEDMVQAIGPGGLMNTYKLAWTKLTELLVIMDKAECKVLDAHDILNAMQYLLTSSVCIKDQATAH